MLDGVKQKSHDWDSFAYLDTQQLSNERYRHSVFLDYLKQYLLIQTIKHSGEEREVLDSFHLINQNYLK